MPEVSGRVKWAPQDDGVWVDGITWAVPGLAVDERTVDPDEITITGAVGDRRVSVRHHVDEHWDVRVVIDGGADPVEVELGGPRPMWGWLAGARGVVLARGDESWWVGQVRQGPVVGGDRLMLGAGSGRRVVSVHWQPVESPAAYVDALPTWLPESLVFPRGDEVALPVMDEAIVSEIQRGTGEVPVLAAATPGWWPVELRGPRGVTSFELGWADSLDEVLSDRVRGIVAAGDYTVPRLMVLSAAGESIDVDLLAGPGQVPEPLLVALLANEVMRTGSPDLADHLVAAAEVLTPAPGALLCLTAAWLALVSAGTDPAPVLSRMARVSVAVPDCERLTVQQRPDVVDLMGRAGFGFVGRPLGPTDPAEQARLAAMLYLVTEPGPAWCRSPGWVAEQVQRALLATGPDDETLAWLTLSRVLAG